LGVKQKFPLAPIPFVPSFRAGRSLKFNRAYACLPKSEEGKKIPEGATKGLQTQEKR
jgi:hypothetical protein